MPTLTGVVCQVGVKPRLAGVLSFRGSVNFETTLRQPPTLVSSDTCDSSLNGIDTLRTLNRPVESSCLQLVTLCILQIRKGSRSIVFVCASHRAEITMPPPDASEDGSAASAASGEDTMKTITLHIVSPHVPDRITFPGLSITTTIQTVKERIQEAVPSRPAPDRQRLIYQGRPLLQGALTLKALFGQAV